ncbi:MAG: methyltransferase domain-containing protein [Thermobacillus sp.]|uniref:Putative S-adenosylmethionine-dependent methyltransferase involved in cell envelope biogenesis n=1 Tax=Thermobacillus composti (strain DSM 18247 / JCM 13945 / KWC4) TaxID=717605 RepID=L0EC26_THECK|nr:MULTISPECIES: class I SAM-dependent methyltransferase [Thermobacillus]AGA57184.1 putative S-adenosylmethionine-dependent methyltransferase involved in cell envelope biogenesis [Thermobacillus composti KWC4]REK56149.1 MAG: methyltransferase domain-containing protein [Thermobacillus sp.]
MGFPSVLTMAHRLAADRIRPGDAVIDATVGNGVDTAFLAKAVGPKGVVYGFDIQQAALDAARARVAAEAPETRLELFLASHHRMAELLPARLMGRVSAVMFNLGYLPGADDVRTVVTRPETTLAALDASLAFLRPGGVLTVVVYTGHEGGREEGEAVDAWARALPASAGQAVLYRMPQLPQAPYLIAVERK